MWCSVVSSETNVSTLIFEKMLALKGESVEWYSVVWCEVR